MVGKFIIGIILSIGIFAIGTTPEATKFAKISEAHAAPVKKMNTNPSPTPKSHTEPLTPSPEPITEVVTIEVPKSNEQIVWERLTQAGYTRSQTAGIMGNLQQEHHFKTSDVPGGLGIAQWMGNRRTNLMQRANYLDINVQVDFLLDELKSTEITTHNAIVNKDSLENAVYAFQNLYERCGVCMQEQRVQYAYDILGRH